MKTTPITLRYPTLKNRRSPTLYPFRGGHKTIKEIAAITGALERKLYYRAKQGLPLDEHVRHGKAPRLIMFRGEQLSIAQIQERTGLSRATVSKRTCGVRFFELDELKAMGVPAINQVRLTYKGRTQCVSAWSREVGLSRTVIRARMKKGRTVAQALTTPDQRGEANRHRNPPNTPAPTTPGGSKGTSKATRGDRRGELRETSTSENKGL
jgi:hypothetical protein